MSFISADLKIKDITEEHFDKYGTFISPGILRDTI